MIFLVKISFGEDLVKCLHFGYDAYNARCKLMLS